MKNAWVIGVIVEFEAFQYRCPTKAELRMVWEQFNSKTQANAQCQLVLFGGSAFVFRRHQEDRAHHASVCRGWPFKIDLSIPKKITWKIEGGLRKYII